MHPASDRRRIILAASAYFHHGCASTTSCPFIEILDASRDDRSSVNREGDPVNTKRVCFCLLLAVWPALLFAQAQTSHADVTLVQRDGWTHRHVTVTLSEDGGSVNILRTDGATLVLPLAEIATVRDAAGMDITDRFVPDVSPSNRSTYGEFGDQGEEVPLQPVAAAKPPRVYPKMFEVMLSAGIGYGTTKGDFYDGFDSGLLYFGDIRFAISNDKYLKFSYRTVKVYEDQVSVVDEGGEYLGEIELTVDVGLDIAASALFKFIAENEGEGGGAILAGHLALMVPFGGGS